MGCDDGDDDNENNCICIERVWVPAIVAEIENSSWGIVI